jgi:hypothetical protein
MGVKMIRWESSGRESTNQKLQGSALRQRLECKRSAVFTTGFFSETAKRQLAFSLAKEQPSAYSG